MKVRDLSLKIAGRMEINSKKCKNFIVKFSPVTPYTPTTCTSWNTPTFVKMDCNSSGCCEVAAATVSYHSSFLTLISSCLSIFGSCLIILTFILWKDVRKSIARIILLFLAIADLCTGMSYLVSSAGFIAYHVQTQNDSNASFNYPIFCTATSFFTTFFPVSSFFWTTNLAVYFFIILVLKKPRWSRKLLIFFNLTAWPIPFIICVTTASFGILGAVAGGDHRNTAGWCFVSLNGTNSYHYDYTTYLLWEALCAKGWELLFFSIVIISYSAIFFVHKKCGCNEVSSCFAWFSMCLAFTACISKGNNTGPL